MEQFLKQFANPEVIRRELILSWVGIGCVHNVGRPEQLFHQAQDLDEMKARFESALNLRLEHQRWAPDLWNDILLCLGMLNTPETESVMRYVSENYKETLVTHISDAAAFVPATDKQMSYLKRLGHPKFKGSKGEASSLIDSLLKKAA
jgi:hypothetical protein